MHTHLRGRVGGWQLAGGGALGVEAGGRHMLIDGWVCIREDRLGIEEVWIDHTSSNTTDSTAATSDSQTDTTDLDPCPRNLCF